MTLPDSTKRHLLMELQVNKVLAIEEGLTKPLMFGSYEFEEDHLIVQVDIARNEIFVINLDSSPKFPKRLNFNDVCVAIENEELFITEMVWPKLAIRPLDNLPKNKQKTASERFEVIKPLVENLEGVLRNSYGENLFQKAIEISGKSKQLVYDYFYGYLRYGQRVAALCLPVGKNIFHVPKEKREVSVKQGRPNKKLARGKVLNDYDEKIFKVGKRLYTQKSGPTLRTTYKMLMRKHYFASRAKYDVATAKRKSQKYRVKLKHRTERPSYWQFYYWLVKEFNGNIPARDKARQNKIENKKDMAGRTGDAFINIIAAGQVFEIDETPFDEELVSVFDPTRRTKIGKATLYFIIDRLTKLIAGLFITTENPSFKTVRQAIFSAARDKTDFISGFGLDPEVIDWPQRGISTSFFVDSAEFRNRISEGAVYDLNCVVKFARRGRGDDKPNVEQLFRIFSLNFQGMSKAHQTKSLQDIAAQLARKHAKLTINELYIIAIVYVNYHNNHRLIKNFPKELEMIRDKVPAIPAKLWEWSMKYRPGYLIHYPDEELYLKLLPTKKVTVHREGIHLIGTGLWYNCEWVLENHFQERSSSRNKATPLNCRYHEDCVDIILLDTEDGLKVATLDENFRKAYGGLSFYEVTLQKKAAAKQDDAYSDTQLEYELGLHEVMEGLMRQADKEKQRGPLPNISTIKDNRKLDALINRYADTNRFLQAYKHQCLDDFSKHGSDGDSDESQDSHSIHDEFDED
jgi:hypothetical protein